MRTGLISRCGPGKRLVAWSCGLLFLLVMPAAATSQVIAPTPASARFLDDNRVDSILLQSFTVYGNSRGLSSQDIRDRYLVMRRQLADLFNALLQNPCQALDRRFKQVSDTDPGFPAARDAYDRALLDAVDRAMKTPESLFPLFEPNYSDRIRSFHADVEVMKNGEIRVHETITIYNGNGQLQPDLFQATMPSWNNDIQRGIVRDFPTRYLDSNGFWTITGFELKSLRKNGKEENFLQEYLSNGTRIKAGNADVILDTGTYVYDIEYVSRRQVIFHPEKDELYWNVNGNGWVFTADAVTCRIRFPEGSAIRESACYTGVLGSTARNCNSRQLSDREIFFSSNTGLGSYEGLTVAASIEKGILVPPGRVEKILAFLKANIILPGMASVLLFLSIFYSIAWHRRGRDPRGGTIIPQFEPPAGITPAQAGYLLRQGYDSSQFAATLVDAAVHRDLDIEVERKGWLVKSTMYRFSKPSGDHRAVSSSTGNRYGISIGSLYGQEAERGTYNPVIKNLNGELKSWLRKNLQVSSSKDGGVRGYFALNMAYGVIGFIILAAALIGGLIFTLNFYSTKLFIISAILFALAVTVHIIFSRIMKAYTPEGRKLTDHILGFRMYLDTTEQHVFQQLTPPEKTLELFEKYLPYAIALNVENNWAEKFDDIVQKAIAQGYQPAYYRGNMMSLSGGFRMSDLSSGISSGLSSTISSASTPPSSSSGGSGGGGSSGGGGGGGGGGGW